MQREASRQSKSTKPDFWKTGAFAVLVTSIVIGASFGIDALIQGDQSYGESRYSEIKVSSNSSNGVTFETEVSGKTYHFYYKSDHYNWKGAWVEFNPRRR